MTLLEKHTVIHSRYANFIIVRPPVGWSGGAPSSLDQLLDVYDWGGTHCVSNAALNKDTTQVNQFGKRVFALKCCNKS